MSDVMLLGVLGMPLPDDPAELDLITWMQVKSRMLEAHERITSDADRIAELERELHIALNHSPQQVEFVLPQEVRELEAEVARLREALKDVIEGWDWWSKDEYDRDQSVVHDAIDEARAALEQTGEHDK